MSSTLRFAWTQSFFIAPPPLTEKNLPDQSGRVYLVTGGNTGIGFQTCGILYGCHAKVYLAARSEAKATEAIAAIQRQHPDSRGQLEFLQLDLADLRSVKAAADDFLQREDKLHWLNNNAGVMGPPTGSTGAQGRELTYQTNVLGPFLFTKLLLPILRRTAQSDPSASVRVSWAGSLGTNMNRPPGGVAWKKDDPEELDDALRVDMIYGATKAANYLLGHEFAKRYGTRDGVMHNTYNPGNLASELPRHVLLHYPAFLIWILSKLLLYPTIFGAYTEIYAGLSPALTVPQDQGAFIVPWGRKEIVRPDIEVEVHKAGGNAEKLFDWCDRITKEYA